MFQGGRSFVELEHCDKLFVKIFRQIFRKILEFFPLKKLLKLHFECKIQPKYRQNQGLFFQNQGTFFRFSKKGRGVLPPPRPSCAPGLFVCLQKLQKKNWQGGLFAPHVPLHILNKIKGLAESLLIFCNIPSKSPSGFFMLMDFNLLPQKHLGGLQSFRVGCHL